MEALQAKVTELTAQNTDLKAQIAELTDKLQKALKCSEGASALLGKLPGSGEETGANEETAEKVEEAREQAAEKAQETAGNVAEQAQEEAGNAAEQAQNAVGKALGSFGW